MVNKFVKPVLKIFSWRYYTLLLLTLSAEVTAGWVSSGIWNSPWWISLLAAIVAGSTIGIPTTLLGLHEIAHHKY